jgi:hypothetical protein
MSAPEPALEALAERGEGAGDLVEIEEAADGVLLATEAAGEPCSGHVPRAYRSIMTTPRESGRVSA